MIMITNEQAIEKLKQQISIVSRLKGQKRFSDDYTKWQRDSRIAIQYIFGQAASHVQDFENIRYGLGACTSNTPDYEFERAFHSGLDKAVALLKSMIDEIHDYRQDMLGASPRSNVETISRICSGFHRVVIQLRSRHNGRPTLDINDEYDVQDLFHALLLIDFCDVRNEEWTPSYAGGCARVDFLLKQEQTVIEIKKTRKGLAYRELGDQLLIDIGRYGVHQDCRLLFCFVYDPENRITNPRGLESDLSKMHGDLLVKVVIAP